MIVAIVQMIKKEFLNNAENGILFKNNSNKSQKVDKLLQSVKKKFFKNKNSFFKKSKKIYNI